MQSSLYHFSTSLCSVLSLLKLWGVGWCWFVSNTQFPLPTVWSGSLYSWLWRTWQLNPQAKCTISLDHPSGSQDEIFVWPRRNEALSSVNWQVANPTRSITDTIHPIIKSVYTRYCLKKVASFKDPHHPGNGLFSPPLGRCGNSEDWTLTASGSRAFVWGSRR